MQEISITIDKNILEKYYLDYFKRFPRRKVHKIKSPIHPSLNEWVIMSRHGANSIKQNWKDFGIWIVESYGYQNKNIMKCDLIVDYYFDTKRVKDLDNLSPKFLLDAFVEAKMLHADDYNVVESILLRGFYSKGVSKSVITFRCKEE